MKVRVLFGRMAGDVVSYPYHVARRLLDHGRAVLPEVDVTVAPEVQAVTSTREVQAPREQVTAGVRVYRKRRP